MTVLTLILLAGLTVPGADQVIDAFDYDDNAAAQEAWTDHGDHGESSAVTMVTDGDRKVLQLGAPFATQPELGRVYIDRTVNLDLAAAGEFTLDVLSSSPEAACRISLYFHSGNGWYSGGTGLARKGWNTLRFSKASFGIEGSPAGWHKVDTIRIGVWRGPAVDYTIRLDRLAAAQHDVALVIPSGDKHQEYKSARKTAEYVGNMLVELGLGSDAVEDTALSHGALGDRRVAILAYNPDLSAEATEALVQFVERGGKLLVCYRLPSRIGEALGFAHPKYVGKKRPGQFAEIRFSADDVAGMPVSIRQASWNVTTAEPAGFRARVIGQWYDEDGKTSGDAAMLLSDRGAFFSHIILRDDLAGKKQMLAAVLGQLDVSLWEQMARAELDGVGRVGHLDGLETLIAFLRAVDGADVKEHLAAAGEQFSNARAEFDRRAYVKVVELCWQRSSGTGPGLSACPAESPARRPSYLESLGNRRLRRRLGSDGQGTRSGRVQHDPAQHALGRSCPLRKRRSAP